MRVPLALALLLAASAMPPAASTMDDAYGRGWRSCALPFELRCVGVWAHLVPTCRWEGPDWVCHVRGALELYVDGPLRCGSASWNWGRVDACAEVFDARDEAEHVERIVVDDDGPVYLVRVTLCEGAGEAARCATVEDFWQPPGPPPPKA